MANSKKEKKRRQKKLSLIYEDKNGPSSYRFTKDKKNFWIKNFPGRID